MASRGILEEKLYGKALLLKMTTLVVVASA